MMELIDILQDINHLNILIVEDSDDIRELMSSTFDKIFQTTHSAIDGVDGLKQFEEDKPDLVITDIRMPNMNGNEMIDKIKQLDSSIPIIAVSGHSKIIKATNKADVVLEKPIEFDKLLEHIYNLTR